MNAPAVYNLLPPSVWNQDADSPTRKLWDAYSAGLTELKTVFEQIAGLRDLENQSGVQLDLTGEILQEPRQEKTDDEYRKFLRIAILRRTSNGSIATLSTISRLILGDEFRGIRNMYPIPSYFDGLGKFDGQSTFSGLKNYRPEDALYADGSEYAEGFYYAAGTRHRPYLIQCRYSAEVSAELAATYQRIIQLAAAAGTAVIFYQEP
jgi:hypothetical protein